MTIEVERGVDDAPSRWDGPRLAFWVSFVAAGPLLIWWLGWYPGFLSTDSIAQLDEIDRFDITNRIPALHTVLVWAVTRIWDSPAAVGLLQVGALVALGAIFAARVTRLGVPWPLSAFSVVVLSWLPAVSATTPALEVQVAQTLVAVWLFVELLELARVGVEGLSRPLSVRLGLALGLVWLLDHAGILVVVAVAAALAIVARRDLRRLTTIGVAAAAVFVVTQVAVYTAFSVDREVTPLGEAYAPEIAAVLVHDRGTFEDDDLDALAAVADLEVWESAYECGDGERLVDDRDFDTDVVAADPGRYRGLLAEAAFSSPGTVLGHRVCAASFLFVPGHPLGDRYETYVYNVPINELGLARDSLWEGAFNMTKAILVRTDQPQQLWLFWRPGLLVWPALAAYVVLAVRRRTHLLWPGLALGAHLLVAALTVRSPSFREAFAVYALSFLSLPLWWLAVRPSRSS